MIRTQKFGASIRRQFMKAIKAKKERYECPKCHKLKLTNVSFAMWRCKSCGAEVSGGAYTPKTEAGEICSRLTEEYAKLS